MKTTRKPGKRNAAGQLVLDAAAPAPPPPEKPALMEIPEIVREYQALVGRAIRSYDNVTKFESRDLNAIAALGRPVTILHALDKGDGEGSADTAKLTTEEMKARLLASERKALSTPQDAEFEEVTDDDE